MPRGGPQPRGGGGRCVWNSWPDLTNLVAVANTASRPSGQENPKFYLWLPLQEEIRCRKRCAQQGEPGLRTWAAVFLQGGSIWAQPHGDAEQELGSQQSDGLSLFQKPSRAHTLVVRL